MYYVHQVSSSLPPLDGVDASDCVIDCDLDNRDKAVKVSHSNSISAVAQKFHPCLIWPQLKTKDCNLIQNCQNYPTFLKNQIEKRTFFLYFILNMICFCCFSESILIIEIISSKKRKYLCTFKSYYVSSKSKLKQTQIFCFLEINIMITSTF